MPIQSINLGNYANDGTGDDLRTAFEKVNANFAALDTEISVSEGVNVGSGIGVYKDKNGVNLEFKSLTSTDDSVEITGSTNTVNLKAKPHIVEDINPALGGNLDLQNFYIYHGDVQTSVYGIDVPALNALVEILLVTNNLSVDMGSFLQPTGSQGLPGDRGTLLDMGYFAYPLPNNNLDFGTF